MQGSLPKTRLDLFDVGLSDLRAADVIESCAELTDVIITPFACPFIATYDDD